MMGHRQVEQAASFERHVPADHLLRSIDRFVELGELRRELAAFYSTMGRPSIDPELMIRMLIIGYCFGIRSGCICQRTSFSGQCGGDAAEQSSSPTIGDSVAKSRHRNNVCRQVAAFRRGPISFSG
jgi:hypothetical protein